MISFSALSLILPAAVMSHVTEEFLFPGGFIEWYKEFRPALADGIKPGYIVWINSLMIGVCILPVYFGPVRHGGINVWYCVAAIAAVNACFHILGVFTLKKYSPGVVTGVLFYIPLFLYGTWWSLSTGYITPAQAVLFLAVAVAYHVFADRGHKAAANKNDSRT
jgi:hypothetical protein